MSRNIGDASGPRFRASPRARTGLGLTASIAIALGGCSGSSGALGSNIKKWQDPETGCVYLIRTADYPTNYATDGMSVRYRADGSPDCPAQAIEARSGETAQQARSGTDESAVRQDAPNTFDNHTRRN